MDDLLRETENPEDRKARLEPYLWQSLADAPLDVGIGDVLGGGLFGMGAAVGGARGRRPKDEKNSKEKRKIHAAGPARRGDFAMTPEGNRAWRAMQQRIRDRMPLGFKSADDVKALTSAYGNAMAGAGHRRTRLALRGSAVTDNSFDETTAKYTGRRFDRGTEASDFDFAIVDDVLFNKAIKSGVRIADSGTRNLQLEVDDLSKLGLHRMAEAVKRLVGGRRHSFVIYGSEKAIIDRGPVIFLTEGTR